MATMKVTVNEAGDLILSDCFSGIGIATDHGLYGISHRDSCIEITLPNGKHLDSEHVLALEDDECTRLREENRSLHESVIVWMGDAILMARVIGGTSEAAEKYIDRCTKIQDEMRAKLADSPPTTEDVCEWHRHSSLDGPLLTVVYVPQCHQFYDLGHPHCDEPEGEYCQYCGDKIKLVTEADHE